MHTRSSKTPPADDAEERGALLAPGDPRSGLRTRTAREERGVATGVAGRTVVLPTPGDADLFERARVAGAGLRGACGGRERGTFEGGAAAPGGAKPYWSLAGAP